MMDFTEGVCCGNDKLYLLFKRQFYTCLKRILGECLLILCLPGKALRMLIDIVRLSEIYI